MVTRRVYSGKQRSVKKSTSSCSPNQVVRYHRVDCSTLTDEHPPCQIGKTEHYSEGKSPLDYLQTAATCYASAIKNSPKDSKAHLGLGLVMEEFFYAEDLYGLQREVYMPCALAHRVCGDTCTYVAMQPKA